MNKIDYFQAIMEEFKDLNMFQAWDIADRRITKHHFGDIDLHLIQSWSYGQPGSILQLATRK